MTNKRFLIDSLRPTQLTLGMVDVNRRASKMAMMSSVELEELLEKKPIPYVVAPKSEIYIVDHHHLCRALWMNGEKNIYLGTELADWSGLPKTDFWKKMDKNGYCWAIDSNGNRRPYFALVDKQGGARMYGKRLNPWLGFACNNHILL